MELAARLLVRGSSLFLPARVDLLAPSAFIHQERLNPVFIPEAREPTVYCSAFLMDLAPVIPISRIRARARSPYREPDEWKRVSASHLG